MTKKLSGAAALIFLGALGFFIFRWAVGAVNSVKAYKTITLMGQIGNILKIEKPVRMDDRDLKAILAKYHRESYLRDGWGHGFEIHVRFDDTGHFHYTIRSLGRDGKRGRCCTGFIGRDWNGDAVLEDDKWLQIWHP